MQWIIEHQAPLIAAISGALVSSGVVGWWIKQKFSFQQRLLEQQLESDRLLHESQQSQLKSSLAEAQQELNELDDDRDKAAFELKQAHGKVMAAMEKLRYFEAVKQERQQYADDINVLKEHKSELEAELREQEARHDQETSPNSEKAANC